MNKFKQFSFNFLFKVSEQPVLFKDLLEANILFNEDIMVDCSKLNYKIKNLNCYCYYGVLCAFILLPLLLATHYFLTLLDFHVSIVSSIIVTSCIFIGFDLFKIYIRKIATKKLIKKAWNNHFPCFSYEKYSKTIENIYKQALKEQIPQNSLRKYIFEQIVLDYSK